MAVRREHVVIVGGGIAGLSTALALARRGHKVTLIDRDVVPISADADEAFFADRRGAPQVHQTHAFLARTVVTLRRHLPDVLDALIAAGATVLPLTQGLGEPQPGDDDLALLVVRRTTYEWVLRKAVLAQHGAEVRMGVGVKCLTAKRGDDTSPPTITGVTLDDGSTVAADALVVASGRRSSVPDWLGALGIEVPEIVHESDLMYLSRWYRRPPGSPPAPELRGVDSGFIKYLAVPGDADTLSITLAIRPGDTELRRALSDPDAFDEACRRLPGPDQFFAETLEAITAVRPMGGLINRLRQFTDDDGHPLVLGFHAVGDAHTCTNPIYGRGCSLALVQALLLADAFTAHPGDAVGRSQYYEAASAREIEPWFHTSVQWDEAAKATDAMRRAGDRTPNPVQALFIAAENEPVLARGLSRLFNLLATPADLMVDLPFAARAAEVMSNPGAFALPDRVGPSRGELLDLLSPIERTA